MTPSHRRVLPRLVRTATAMLLGVAMLAALAPRAYAAAPPNDDQANPVAVTALPASLSADVSEATLARDEHTGACIEIGHTVWYSVTLPETTTVLVDTAGSDFDTAFIVWPGNTEGEFVTCAGDTADGPLARASFVADAGQTYLFQVGAQGGDLEPGTGQLQVAFSVAPRATGKPAVFGSRSAGLFAVAVWESTTPTVSAITQVRLTEDSSHDFRTPNRGGTPDVEVLSQRFTTNPDGSWLAEEWYGFVTPSAAEFQLRANLRNAMVNTELVVEYTTCSAAAPDVPEPDCTTAVRFPVRVTVTWTGRSALITDNLHVRSGELAFIFNSTDHLTRRDAAANGSVVGEAITLAEGDASLAVLGRAAQVQTFFLRGD